MCVWLFAFVTMLFGNNSIPLENAATGATFVRKMLFWVEYQSWCMWVAPIKLPNLLCPCQIAFSTIGIGPCLPAVPNLSVSASSLSTCGITVGMLFISKWPTQPHWLTFSKCLEWDVIQQQCVTKLVSSKRKQWQAFVAVYGSSTC